MKKRSEKKFRLWTYIKPYKTPFFLACVSIVLENMLEISLPFLMNILLKKGMTELDDGSYTYDKAFVFTIAGIMIGFAVCSFLLGLLSAKMTAKAGRGFGYELRKAQYRKIQEFSFMNLDDFRLNSLITRMTNDIQILSDTLCQIMRPILRGPFQLFFALIFAYTISKELSVVFLIVIPILAILLTLIVMFSRKKFYLLQNSLDSINRTTDESLTAMKLIRANSKKDYEIEKFANVNGEVRDLGKSALSLVALNMGLMQMMTYITVIGILVIGGSGILQNWHPDRNATATAADIASFLSYATQTLASLMMLSNVFMSFTRASASMQRVKEVFVCESEIEEKTDASTTFEDGSIVFDHVFFKYDKSAERNVLDDISFSFENGMTIGILGETGSSKSTLVYLIDRFYDVTDGKIMVGGHDIKDYSLKHLRDSISISFQGPRLFTGTVKDNLLWGNENATEEEIKEACRIACAKDFIENTLPNGYDTMVGQGGSNVSGGQRQRICIARAILKKPKILILDDSFSALDRVTENIVKENLRTSLKGTTKIIISQKVSAIHDADIIVVLNDGKIHNIGTGDYLMKNDSIYQDIYQIQKEGH